MQKELLARVVLCASCEDSALSEVSRSQRDNAVRFYSCKVSRSVTVAGAEGRMEVSGGGRRGGGSREESEAKIVSVGR